MHKRRLLKVSDVGRGVTFEEAMTFAALTEEVFNKKRLYSNLGYIPPVGFEAGYAPKGGSSPKHHGEACVPLSYTSDRECRLSPQRRKSSSLLLYRLGKEPTDASRMGQMAYAPDYFSF
jgi:hypothetical protein